MIKPYITEKSMLNANEGKYTFCVSSDYTKNMVETEVKKIFNVDVSKVTILNRQGKSGYFKKKLGRRNDLKIAIATLKKGQKISEFTVEEPKKETKQIKKEANNDKKSKTDN